MRYLVLLALVSMAASLSLQLETKLYDPQLDKYWDMYKKVFQKSYSLQEETTRRIIWEQHVSDIFLHNMQANMGLHSYTKGLNEYSDLTAAEFSRYLLGFKMAANATSSGSSWLHPGNVQVPDDLDWRKQGFVTPVKNQGDCGSCWAFSATGSLEGQQKRKSGTLVSLSEQNLIDCSSKQGNDGCDGGWMDQAFDYVKQNDGIDTEDSYPYHAKDEKCHYKKSQRGATATGYVDLPSGKEDDLQVALATVGPVSVAIHVADGFWHYKNGVFDAPECPSDIFGLGHAVLAVGYGTQDGKDYWLVKNSWGESWGDKGYVKMSRNKNNQCGIATKASYPLV